MAVHRAAIKDIPSDAVILSKSEAADKMWSTVKKWKPQTDVLPLRFSPGLCGLMAGSVGVSVNEHIRRNLKLRNYAYLSSTLPMTAVPAVFAMGAHFYLVTSDIMIGNTRCPLCVETRSLAAQAIFGMVYPLLLSPLLNFKFAVRFGTYPVPSLLKEPSQVLRLYLRMLKPIQQRLFLFGAVQSVFVTALTYFQYKNSLWLHKTMSEQEKLLENYITMKRRDA